MNKEKVFQHFSEILDNMLDNSLFFETYWQAPYSMDSISGSIDDNAISENIHLNFGISRGCIIDDDFDYVVKFDIESDNFGDSLCNREIDIYNAARANHLDTYFTAPTYLGTYCKIINFYDIKKIEYYMNWVDYDPQQFDEDFAKEEDNFGDIIPITINIPLYAYPKANKYSYTIFQDNEVEEYKKKAKSVNSPLKGRHLQIAMEFIFRYGMEQYEKLSDFMREYHINDIHYGNIGEMNGNFVCFDFAGYHSEYDDEEEESSY